VEIVYGILDYIKSAKVKIFTDTMLVIANKQEVVKSPMSA